MPIARSTYAGIAAGAVLLAGAVGFGVGLPKVVDDPGASAELPSLPDKIDDRFVALSAVTPEQGGAKTDQEIDQMKAFTDEAAKSESQAKKRLTSIYGDVEVRSYLDVPATVAGNAQARPAQFAVTVIPGDAGLVIPSGPFQIDQSGTHYELKQLGGYRCSLIWSEPVDQTTGVPTGAEPDGSSYQVECRAERAGLTYDLYSSGLKPEEAVHYLDLILEKTASDA